MNKLKNIILQGESQNVEFKVELPDKSEKYVKTIMGTDFRVEFFKNKVGTTTKTTQKTTQKILELIQNKPEISRRELALICELSEEGIKYQLSMMKKKNIIKRVGPDNGGFWEIVEKDMQTN